MTRSQRLKRIQCVDLNYDPLRHLWVALHQLFGSRCWLPARRSSAAIARMFRPLATLV
jgi:hypothetical protein